MVGDMMATLAELDERLAALQREMQAVQAAPANGARLSASVPPPASVPAAPPALRVPAPAATAPVIPAFAVPAAPAVQATVNVDLPPAAPVAQLSLDELVRWRERLRRGVAELSALIAEVDVKLAGLAPATSPLRTPAPAPAPAPAPTSTPTAAASGSQGPSFPSAAAPVPTPHDRTFEGRVLVDAGPFADISAVTTFQHALEQIPGAREVYVTGFDFNRALVELDLSDPVALGREIRAVLPFNFAIFEAGHGRLAINVDAGSVTRWQGGDPQ
jgi:hypothetical protein